MKQEIKQSMKALENKIKEYKKVLTENNCNDDEIDIINMLIWYIDDLELSYGEIPRF